MLTGVGSGGTVADPAWTETLWAGSGGTSTRNSTGITVSAFFRKRLWQPGNTTASATMAACVAETYRKQRRKRSLIFACALPPG
jgi:hypothetical protein